MCEQILNPLFHFDHLPTQVPKSLHCLQDSESARILANFVGGYSPTDPPAGEVAKPFRLEGTYKEVTQSKENLPNSNKHKPAVQAAGADPSR